LSLREPKSSIQVIERMMNLLDALARHTAPVNLKQLATETTLSVRHKDEVVYVERTAPGSSMMRVVQIIGTRAPLHITAVGKIFLAHDGPAFCTEYAERTGLPRYTDNTLTDAEALAREIQSVRRQGYAFDNEEAEKGVACIGAGIYNDEGSLVAGLSISAPSDRFRRDWAQQVRESAEKISRAIGYQGDAVEESEERRQA
jgi:DNA-binding IclR family transcriptional regulator